MKYDRFDLEEEIMKVWSTEEDLDTVLYRIMDAHDSMEELEEAREDQENEMTENVLLN